MDYKKNLRYFENKKAMLYVGAALIAVGVVSFLLWRFTVHYYFFYPCMLFLITGGVLFTVSKTSRSSDKSIDEAIDDTFKQFEEQTLTRFDLYDRQLPYVESALLEGYKYYDGSYIVRDKSGGYRTDVYAKTHVYFTKTELCIGAYEISLIKDDQTDKSVSIPYESIKEAYLTDGETTYNMKNKSVTVNYQTLHIKTTDGEFTSQAQSSQTLDTLVEDINRVIAR